jgi:hypothetical protein
MDGGNSGSFMEKLAPLYHSVRVRKIVNTMLKKNSAGTNTCADDNTLIA